EVKDSAPGIEWWLDAPYLPFLGGTGSTVQHHVVVARGYHTLDLYVNGQFFDSQTNQQRKLFHIGWGGFSVGASALGGPRQAFFQGTLQHFAVYPRPFTATDALTHYAAGTQTGTTGGAGELDLLYALPFTPQAGDQFQVFPGCNHTMADCTRKFSNSPNYGGQQFIPPPETGL